MTESTWHRRSSGNPPSGSGGSGGSTPGRTHTFSRIARQPAQATWREPGLAADAGYTDPPRQPHDIGYAGAGASAHLPPWEAKPARRGWTVLIVVGSLLLLVGAAASLLWFAAARPSPHAVARIPAMDQVAGPVDPALTERVTALEKAVQRLESRLPEQGAAVQQQDPGLGARLDTLEQRLDTLATVLATLSHDPGAEAVAPSPGIATPTPQPPGAATGAPAAPPFPLPAPKPIPRTSPAPNR